MSSCLQDELGGDPFNANEQDIIEAYASLASLVQLVERRSPKPDVEGSSPSGRGFNKRNCKTMMNGENNQANETIESIKTYFRGVKAGRPNNSGQTGIIPDGRP